MMRAAARNLSANVEAVNALNVFPVPDGDTGTNMNLTLTSGVREMELAASAGSVGKLAEALSKGLLMGARGNSGVILSQLFRGFAKGVADKETLTARQFADAFQRGVETAYKAVIKPVEGTVLTVAREAADAGMKVAWTTEDPVVVMETVLREAHRSLAKTPELLPVLKQAGVVDAGGQGLVCVYEGMLAAMKGEEIEPVSPVSQTDAESLARMAHDNAQAKVDPSEIEHGYCTEFMILLKTDRRPTEPFDEVTFRKEMEQFGDSLLVVADEELVKVHIHAERPGDALNHAMKYGDLTRIKIDNMREQYEQVTEGHHPHGTKEPEKAEKPKQRYGVVAVAAGDGIAGIFRSMGADVVIEGGQTMNPSTEEIVRAITEANAEHVVILPNNKNIILTAEQAAEVTGADVTVLPTRTIPQGIAALLAFDRSGSPEENRERMNEAAAHVQSGEVTYAVRDSKVGDVEIKSGDLLGIREGKIEVTGSDLNETARRLLDKMLEDGGEVVTILYGRDTAEDSANELAEKLLEEHPDLEVEVHKGGQPVYYYIFSVE
ncbi:DAK2 domain-containing protein [Staphylospora marina]|uniref:DAK2 domain-containing protein n=1 Tax=Staphylospora marina TaxID=2490858 RepID=UPI000F5BA841|nr:DAK2 domain-containing protein [Staphylospora marina]